MRESLLTAKWKVGELSFGPMATGARECGETTSSTGLECFITTRQVQAQTKNGAMEKDGAGQSLLVQEEHHHLRIISSQIQVQRKRAGRDE